MEGDKAFPCPQCGHQPGQKGQKQRKRRALLRIHRERQQNMCCWCERPLCNVANHPLAATLEHLTRLSEGGEDTLENTRAACMECNSTRHSKTRAERLISAWESLGAQA